jgi:hypothetical protein
MKKLRDFKRPERDRVLQFWGPVGIAVGITLLLLNVQVTAATINFELKVGLEAFNLVAGIVLIVLGLLALLLITQGEKIALARVGLGSGVLIFFWGTHVFNTLYKTNPAIGFGLGWAGIIVGLVLIVMGYIWAPK